MTSAIRTEHITRTYIRKKKDPFTALAGVDLDVKPGELFGLLGPNGAGKTTLIKILTTLLAPSTGRAWVNGFDVVAEADKVRPLINMVSGGETSGYGILTVRENIWLFARIYGVPNDVIKSRTDEMLEVVGLKDKGDSRVSHLSTGQRQKMNFCRGFVTDPTVLFLDEPTLGLDVNAARAIRNYIRKWIAEKPGRTILLTTHYMAEADELCDRLAIIDSGKVLACDTPAKLKRRVQEYPLYDITVSPGFRADLKTLPGVHQVTQTETPDATTLKVSLTDEAAVGAVVQTIASAGGTVRSLSRIEPTLEDAFIELVGHGLGSETSQSPGS
ncbi:MAG: ABC transporter ATP-binding protein [Gemmataceae bacterium]